MAWVQRGDLAVLTAAAAARRIPGLDGLRGLAVVMVLLFHAGFRFAAGGYIGVSIFFTLSGYLITSLTVREPRLAPSAEPVRPTDEIRSFWRRRFRRIGPPAIIVLVSIAIAARLGGFPHGVPNFFGQILSASVGVLNWQLWVSGDDYATLFAAPSPVVHYWSLAIEAQFYLLSPTLIWIRRRLGTQMTLWGILGLVLFLLLISHGSGAAPTQLYYGTHSRAPEFLVGVGLALLIHLLPGSPHRPIDRPATNTSTALALRSTMPARREDMTPAAAVDHAELSRSAHLGGWAASMMPLIAAWLSPVAIAVLFLAASQLDLARLDIAAGHLLGVSVATAIVVLGIVYQTGPVNWVLSLAPLRVIGRISFSLYLVHWPVFLMLSAPRINLGHIPLAALRIAASLVVAVVLYLHVERDGATRWRDRALPDRAPPRPAGRTRRLHTLSGLRATRARPGISFAACALIALIAATGVPQGVEQYDLNQAADPVTAGTTSTTLITSPVDDEHGTEPEGSPAQGPHADDEGGADENIERNHGGYHSALPEAPAPRDQVHPRVVMVGDSQVLVLAMAMIEHSERLPMDIVDLSHLGCGIGRSGSVRYHNRTDPVKTNCGLWDEQRFTAAMASDPTVVLIWTGPWDFADRQLPGDHQWRSPGDPVYDAYLYDEFTAASRRFGDEVPIVWLTSPPIDVGRLDLVPPHYPTNEPERAQHLNAILRAVAEAEGDEVWDLAEFMAHCPGGSLDAQLRPDGVHLSVDGASIVVDWLYPSLVEVSTYGSGPHTEPHGRCASAGADG